jgi:hypothetical protein
VLPSEAGRLAGIQFTDGDCRTAAQTKLQDMVTLARGIAAATPAH